MCPPDHYGIQYEINPWMHRREAADRRLAARQWQALRSLLEECGAAVSCLPGVAGLPDLVFTANAAVVWRQVAVPARFRYPERRGEEPHGRQWLCEHGFEVRELAAGVFFEGAGDALFCGDTLWAGYRFRSDIRGHQGLGDLLECRVLSLELVDPRFYHLDTCFCPLAPGTAIWYPAAFDEYARRVLAGSIDDLIAVSAAEAGNFACNAVVVGRTVITNTGCHELHRALAARGFLPRSTPLGEFVKAGGAAKCLTLRLDGEEAAGWKQAVTARAAAHGSGPDGLVRS
jgi:N-dimethylarginine dimethylaminohydrolase